jgi:type II secretory pathway pseudopilin PulG
MAKQELVKVTIFNLSLTNLLVSIFIIAILVTILMPVFGNIIENARIMADQANAHMLYQATVAYAITYNGNIGKVAPAVLSPFIGNNWPSVMSKMFAGNFLCEISQDGRILVTTGSAVYDPSTGCLVKEPLSTIDPIASTMFH